MSGDVTMKVEGLRELEAALLEIADKAPALIAKGLRDPMVAVRDEARLLVAKRTGELHDAIDLTPLRRASAKRASMEDVLSEVGLRIKPAKAGKVATGGSRKKRALPPRARWHMLEFGTAHSAAKPFIRPAFDKLAPSMPGEMKRIVGEGIEKLAKRRRRKR